MNTLQNWTNAAAQLVIIRAVKIVDGPFHTYYTPEIQIVFNLQGSQRASSGVVLKLDARYDTVHELAMRTSMWADTMFNQVDTSIVVVAEDGSVIETLDIRTEFGVEIAEMELRELKRDNNFAIH